MSSENQGTWVYGVVPAGSSLDELDRRADRLPDVRVVEAGDLAALVSDPPESDPKATRDQALAHARVLEAAIVDAPVVPFRFGIIVPENEDVAGDLLEARRDELAERLKRVGDRVQMTLKVYYNEEAVLSEILANEPEAARLREATREGDEAATRNERVRLGELISTALEQRREHDSKEIMEHLQGVSVAAVVEALEKEFMLVNAPFLVERDRLEEFESAVEALAEEREGRMRFRLLGPMPAYHFIDVEQPAWA
jgi:hypothetical protein